MAGFDVREFIDRQRLNRTHVVIVVLALLAMFVDGFDIFMIGKIAPAIADGFAVGPEQLTLIFVLQQTGLAVGSFVVSPLSDLYGRKRLLVVSFLAFGVLTIAGAFATSILQLAILRGIAGLFLAGVLPAVLALVSEFTPTAHRSTVVGLVQAGYGAGNAMGASVAFLVPLFGWQGAFWAGGLIALALTPFLAIFLHESLSYLTTRRPDDPRIGKILRRIDPELRLGGSEQFAVSAPRASSATLMQVFSEGRAVPTFAFWSCYLLSMGNITLIAAWLPTYFRTFAGISIQEFAVVLMLGLTGGLVGTMTVGFLMDRVRPLWLVAFYYVGNAAMLALLGHTPFHNGAFLPILIAFAFFQGGGQGGLNVLLTLFYPPSVRSTGLGWAGGVGRLGGIAAPALGGLAVSHALGLSTTLSLVACSPLIVALLLMFVLMPAHAAAERRARTSAIPAPVAQEVS